MQSPQRKTQTRQQTIEDKLPLVMEIIPGQASEGVVKVFEAGTYENKNVNDLVNQALGADYSIEQQQVVRDVQSQLHNGKLLHNSKTATGLATDFAVKEQTRNQEDYLYVELRAIKPQEGGLYR